MTKRRKDLDEVLVAVYRDHADEIVEARAQQAADFLKTLQERETSGVPIKQKDPTYPRRKAEKIAVAALYECVEVLGRVPPFELVELIAHLLNRPADADILEDRSEKYYRAANYLADHPEASLREVGRAVGVSKDTIKLWKGEEFFCKMINMRNLAMEAARHKAARLREVASE